MSGWAVDREGRVSGLARASPQAHLGLAYTFPSTSNLSHEAWCPAIPIAQALGRRLDRLPPPVSDPNLARTRPLPFAINVLLTVSPRLHPTSYPRCVIPHHVRQHRRLQEYATCPPPSIQLPLVVAVILMPPFPRDRNPRGTG